MNEIQKIENYISNLTINNVYPPKSLNEFDELDSFEDFEDLKRQINEGLIKLIIPDHLLYSNFKETSTKKYKFLSTFFSLFPYIIGLIFLVIGFSENNYLLFLTIPICFFAFYLSAYFRNFIFHFMLMCFGIYLMTTPNFNIGAFVFTYSITIISSILFRTYRRLGFIKSAESSEKIFCFLFYARNISVYDNILKIIIKSL